MAVNTAARVFSILELAENILLHLDTVDLLSVSQVDQTLFDLIVKTSKPLRKNLMLEPDDNCEYHDLDIRILKAAGIVVLGVSDRVRRVSGLVPLSDPRTPPSRLVLTNTQPLAPANQRRSRRRHLVFGERILKMQLSQPPLRNWKMMTRSDHVTFNCGYIQRDDCRIMALDDSFDGTLGALLREAARIRSLLPSEPACGFDYRGPWNLSAVGVLQPKDSPVADGK